MTHSSENLEDMLPKITEAPPPKTAIEQAKDDVGIVDNPEDEKQETIFQEPKKLLDDVDAKDWRSANGKKAPGMRGKDTKPRKKPAMTEKKLAALAKAREASVRKAKARREALNQQEQTQEEPLHEVQNEIVQENVKVDIQPPSRSVREPRKPVSNTTVPKQAFNAPTPPSSPQDNIKYVTKERPNVMSDRKYSLQELSELQSFFSPHASRHLTTPTPRTQQHSADHPPLEPPKLTRQKATIGRSQAHAIARRSTNRTHQVQQQAEQGKWDHLFLKNPYKKG